MSGPSEFETLLKNWIVNNVTLRIRTETGPNRLEIEMWADDQKVDTRSILGEHLNDILT